MPTLQLSFSQQVFSALPGQLTDAFSPRRATNKFGRDLLRAGLMAFQLPATGEAIANQSRRGYPGEVYQIVAYGVGADVDAIGTITSATGTKTVGSGVTAGVAAANTLNPARKLTFTFDASTDWDATVGVVTYVNQLGVTVTENIAIATSTAPSTVGLAKQFESFAVPTQTGAGGAATIGIAAISAGALTLADCAGVVIRQTHKTMPSNPSNLYSLPNVAAGSPIAHYSDGDTVPLLEIGDIWVETEEAVADRDPVFVRIAAGAGGSQIGAFRNDADTASCIAVTGARFKRAAAAGVAWASFAAF